MIDVKIISKPKNEGSTSAVNTGSTAYGSMAVKEAAHAAKADIAETAKEAEYASKAKGGSSFRGKSCPCSRDS